MVIFLLLGFVAGAALVGAMAWWRHRRTQRQLAQVAQALAALDPASFGLLPASAGHSAEVARLTCQVNQLLARLQRSVESQRTFVVHASHKLRTPLTILRGQIEVALLRPRSAAEHEHTLRTLLQDIAGLNQLSNDLLLLNQLEADHYQLPRQAVDLDEVLFQACHKLNAQHPAHRVTLAFDELLAEQLGPLTVSGDPDLLEQACLHLLDNGCKFSPAGQVQVLLKRSGPHARLEFRDHGSGIQLKEQPRIFEPFFRGSNARSCPGHGLGLALVQRVVELHAGTVQVVSGPGPGTAMAVELPLAH